MKIMTYATKEDAQAALDQVAANMAAFYANEGYDVGDGQIHGKTLDETNTEAVGTREWSPLYEQNGVWGFFVPPDNFMDNVTPGVVIDYLAPEPENE